jgi:hypothetical protein
MIGILFIIWVFVKIEGIAIVIDERRKIPFGTQGVHDVPSRSRGSPYPDIWDGGCPRWQDFLFG